MSHWSPTDWGLFFLAAGPFVILVAAQIERLIRALKANTTATDTSATALTVLAPAVDANTVVTRAVADATSPVTVNVTPAVADPPEPRPLRP